jgi:hypothetical protein
MTRNPFGIAMRRFLFHFITVAIASQRPRRVAVAVLQQRKQNFVT